MKPIIKQFKDKKIIIRNIGLKDIKRAREYQEYINSLVLENAKILFNRKMSVLEEKNFIIESIRAARKKVGVGIVVESDGKIIGISDIKLDRYKRDHIGILGISIRNGYRGMGIGELLIRSVMDEAINVLKPKLKILMLTVYEDNIPAKNLYKKIGFKNVAYIPNAIQTGKDKELVGEYIMIKEV